MGGLNAVLGVLRAPRAGRRPGVVLVSNRGGGVERFAAGAGETRGVSNGGVGEAGWGKVGRGEAGVRSAVAAHVAAGEGREGLVERLFGVLGEEVEGEEGVRMRESVWMRPVGGRRGRMGRRR